MLLPLAALSAPGLEVDRRGRDRDAGHRAAVHRDRVADAVPAQPRRRAAGYQHGHVPQPVFGTLWGAVFLAEAVSAGFLAGAALVFVALALILDLRLPVRGASGSATARGGTPSGAAAERRSP